MPAALGYPQQPLSGKVCRALRRRGDREEGCQVARVQDAGGRVDCGLDPALVPLSGDGVPVTTMPVPNRLAVPVTLASQQAGTRTATLEQLRERLESGEPPEKKASRLSEEEQRLVQQAFQRNFFSMARQLPMKIRINGRGEHQACTPNTCSIQEPVPISGTEVGPLQVLPPGPPSVAVEISIHQAEVIFQGT